MGRTSHDDWFFFLSRHKKVKNAHLINGDVMDKLKNEKYIKLILLWSIIAITFYIIGDIYHVFNLVKITIEALIPVLIGVFISFLLEPLIIRLTRLKIKRNIACFMVYLTIAFLFAGSLIYLIPKMTAQLQGFIDYLPSLSSYYKSFENSEMSRILSSFHLEEQLSNLIQTCCGTLFSRVGNLMDSFFQLGIGAGAALYLSLDFKKVTCYYYDLAPRKYRKEYREISKKIGHCTFMFLRSMLYDTLIFFVVSALVLTVFKFDYPLIFAAILAGTNLIPYIGPYIGLIPLAIAGFMTSQMQGIIAIIISFGLQSLESSLIQPILLQNMIYLHPVVGIFGISFFGALFGVVGMIFSPLLMIIVKILYEDIVFKKIWLEKEEKIVYNFNEIDDKDK